MPKLMKLLTAVMLITSVVSIRQIGNAEARCRDGQYGGDAGQWGDGLGNLGVLGFGWGQGNPYFYGSALQLRFMFQFGVMGTG